MVQLLTLQEVAETLKVSYFRVCQLTRENLLPCVSLGRQKRIDPRKLQEFIDSGGRQLPGGWRKRALDAGQQTQAIRD